MQISLLQPEDIHQAQNSTFTLSTVDVKGSTATLLEFHTRRLKALWCMSHYILCPHNQKKVTWSRLAGQPFTLDAVTSLWNTKH